MIGRQVRWTPTDGPAIEGVVTEASPSRISIRTSDICTEHLLLRDGGLYGQGERLGPLEFVWGAYADEAHPIAPAPATEPCKTEDRSCGICGVRLDRGAVCREADGCNARADERERDARDPHLLRAARDLGMTHVEARERYRAGNKQVIEARSRAKVANLYDQYMGRSLPLGGSLRRAGDPWYTEPISIKVDPETARKLLADLDRPRPSARAWMFGGRRIESLTHDETTLEVPSLRVSSCATACGRGGADPTDHLPDCPVAPVAGLHGGMRATPVPAGKVREWRPYVCTGWWEGLETGRGWLLVQPAEPVHCDPGVADLVLAGFYLPPTPEAEPDPRPPVEQDPDLAAVADAASRWPGGWRPR